MIDTRAVAQEVQDQLTAAMHKGQEQLRKGQEQVRKGRETVTGALRTGSHLAQAVKPNLPALPVPSLQSLSELASPEKLRASAHELAGQVLATQRKLTDQAFASQRKLADHAQELAEQTVATQRRLSGKALEVATPLITDGFARLTQVAGSVVPSSRARHSKQAETAKATTKPAAVASAKAESAAEVLDVQASAGAKPRTARAGSAKAGTAKARST